jgi:sulfoxide reductase catalytic subunit YedY
MSDIAPSEPRPSEQGPGVLRADLPEQGGSGRDRPIGRRAFIVLLLAGAAALFLGKDLFGLFQGGGKRATGTEGFRINSIAPAPAFDETTWRLSVDGLVRRPLSLTFGEFKALSQVEVLRDFYCVEGWGVEAVTWTGVPLSEIMKLCGVDPQMTHLIFYSGDGVYTDSVTKEEALRSDTLLAHRLNGEALTKDMGRPVRLVLPGSYGYKYVKWVVRVEAVALGAEGYKGFWERNGYPSDATI